jgi:hypothetical protein
VLMPIGYRSCNENIQGHQKDAKDIFIFFYKCQHCVFETMLQI